MSLLSSAKLVWLKQEESNSKVSDLRKMSVTVLMNLLLLISIDHSLESPGRPRPGDLFELKFCAFLRVEIIESNMGS